MEDRGWVRRRGRPTAPGRSFLVRLVLSCWAQMGLSVGPRPELAAKAGSAAEEPVRLSVGATQG